MLVLAGIFCQDAAQIAADQTAAEPGERPWLDFVEIAEVRWRTVKDFARGAERAWEMLRRRLLRLQLQRRHPSFLHKRLSRCMPRRRCRLHRLRLLRVRRG